MADKKDIVDAASDVAGKGVDAAKGALGAVGGIIGGLADKAKDAVGDAAEGVANAVEDVVGGAADVAAKGVDAVKGAVEGAGDAVEGVVGKVGDVAGDAVDAVKGVVGGAADAVGDVAGKGVDAVKGLAEGAGDVVGAAADVVGDVAGKGVDAVKGVGGAALGAGAAVLGGAAAIAGGLGKGLKDGAEKVGDVAGDAVGAVGDVAGKGVDAAKGAFGAAANATREVVEDGGKKGGFLLPFLGLVAVVGGLGWFLTHLGAKAPSAEAPAVAAAPAALPAWLTKLGDGLKAKFPWLSLDLKGNSVVVSGEAPDKNAKDALMGEIATALEASEGKGSLLIDNVSVKGDTAAPVGAALAKLGENPDAAACGTAFTETMAGRTINFATGKAVINADSSSLLGALTGIATACKSHSIEVAGHTDAKGDAAKNKALSQARADAVVKFWTDKGVPAAGLKAVGYGQEKLLDTSGTPEGDAKNRRVEFTVSDAAAPK